LFNKLSIFKFIKQKYIIKKVYSKLTKKEDLIKVATFNNISKNMYNKKSFTFE